MKRSDINPMPQYFDHYINLVADVELPNAFAASVRQLNDLDSKLLTALDGKKYDTRQVDREGNSAARYRL